MCVTQRQAVDEERLCETASLAGGGTVWRASGRTKGDIWSLNEVKVHSNELTVFRFPLPYASLSFCRCPRPPVWTSRSFSGDKEMNIEERKKKGVRIDKHSSGKRTELNSQSITRSIIIIWDSLSSIALMRNQLGVNFGPSTDLRSVYLLELVILCRREGNTTLTSDQEGICPRAHPTLEPRARSSWLIGLLGHTLTQTHTHAHTGLTCRAALANTCQTATSGNLRILFNCHKQLTVDAKL